ncbi:hypothetical protein GcC1_017018 [Golovinomyces cichoracearum]|uniref:Uncharacterized protein n=1 Tax=Golovinomyces cichoracearum TaxID=62708 RepID=A0A420J5Y0_9PEZI|nr:hypothetical protein GcC1_017018 [Golovinomyces cichoracearum]
MEPIDSALDYHCLNREESVSPTTIPRNMDSEKTCSQLSRSLSINSTRSALSIETNSTRRESVGSATSYSDNSFFHSSLSSSSSSNLKAGRPLKWNGKPLRRGYVRPQGTNFAASAKSRESVLSLGSIAHLQYYFARTGLLDGKGGRRARKKPNQDSLDYSALDASFISINTSSDADSIVTSMESNPEYPIVRGENDSSMIDEEESGFYSSENDENHPHMLPPTVSTYNHREKHIPHPPTLGELREELIKTLLDASSALTELDSEADTHPKSPIRPSSTDKGNGEQTNKENHGWHQVQGVHILDVMTLAIRAAKIYYTAHERPARLAAIKPEKHVRSELLSIMEVLRKMATRNFASGIKNEERKIMEQWLNNTQDILLREKAMIEEERSECARWIWLDDNWSGSPANREWAFMKSMDPDSDSLPEFQSVDEVSDEELPTEFLKDLTTGLRLVKLHNAIVRRSKRPFGAIEKWHTDFGKPYRSTENLLFWIKAAELRFEIILNVDVTGVVHGASREVWKQFENAILTWCGTVRREISTELES